jgi:hypothetical protein
MGEDGTGRDMYTEQSLAKTDVGVGDTREGSLGTRR